VFSGNQKPQRDWFQEKLGISSAEALTLLTKGFPADLSYKLKVTKIPFEPDGTFGFRLQGLDTQGDEALFFEQNLNLGTKVAENSDIFVRKEYRGGGTGIFIRYNSFDLFRRAGMDRAEISTAHMGGYAWARYGALLDPDVVQPRNLLSQQLYEDFAFLAMGVPAKDRTKAEKLIELSGDTDHWELADIKACPLVSELPSGREPLREVFLRHVGGIDKANAQTVKVADQMAAKVDSISRYYDMAPDRMSLGLLLLYGTYWKGNFYLTEGQHPDQLKQWERIEAYMDSKTAQRGVSSETALTGIRYEKT
jgi:hypothetical protein